MDVQDPNPRQPRAQFAPLGQAGAYHPQRSAPYGARRRVFAALMAAVFGLTGVAQAVGLQPCPHHVAPSDRHADGAARVDHRPHSHEHHHTSHGASESSPADDHSEHTPCSCVGACHAGAATPLPRESQPLLALGGHHRVASTWLRDTQSLTTTPAHVLPFANGPPSLG